MYSIDSGPTFGEVKINVLFLDSAMSSFSDFFDTKEEIGNNEPLIIKVSWFRVPGTIGSKESIDLCNEFENTKEKDILKLILLKLLLRLDGID
jgi:hypothetical protein